MTHIIPAIDGITIRQHDGLFSLTDLHKASGGESRHQPAFFLRREETKALVCEISQSANLQIAVKTERLGEDRGTYACRELVIAYAAWISPAFHLKVIRVFLDAAAPKPEPLPPLPYKEQPGQSLSEPQCAELRAMLTGGAAQVPEDMRGQFMVTGWSRLKAHFGCNYRKIPAEHFGEARSLIARHIADFTPAPAPAPAINPFNTQALDAARKIAFDWIHGEKTATDIPDDVLCGLVSHALQECRFLIDFKPWLWSGGQDGISVIKKTDTFINYDTTSAEAIAGNFPLHRVPEIIAALTRRVAKALPAPAAQ